MEALRRPHPAGAVPVWIRTWPEARYRVDSAWSGRTSLRTTQWDDAIFIAVDRLAEREQAAKVGVPQPARNRREVNSEVAVVTLARLEAKKR